VSFGDVRLERGGVRVPNVHATARRARRHKVAVGAEARLWRQHPALWWLLGVRVVCVCAVVCVRKSKARA
jgi:hypothetical protein